MKGFWSEAAIIAMLSGFQLVAAIRERSALEIVVWGLSCLIWLIVTFGRLTDRQW